MWQVYCINTVMKVVTAIEKIKHITYSQAQIILLGEKTLASRNTFLQIIGDRQDIIIHLVFNLLVTMLVGPAGALTLSRIFF